MATTSPRDPISTGALMLILCLAVPMGVLSLNAPKTTADEADAAQAILVARVAALQEVRETDEGVTLVQFEVERAIAGQSTPSRFQMTLPGRPAIEVSDLQLVFLSFDPPTLHAAYPVRKDRKTLAYEVLTPVTGLYSEGVNNVGPVSLDVVENGLRLRRGLNARSPRPAAAPAPEADDSDRTGTHTGASPGTSTGTGTGTGASDTGRPQAPGQGAGSVGNAGAGGQGGPGGTAGPGGAGGHGGPGAQAGHSPPPSEAPLPGTADDHGNTIAEATPVVLSLPHPIPGLPTAVTGLLVPGDVDYFSFDAPVLSLLHAETRFPAGLTGLPRDTIMGLFDATSGKLLASDDDGGAGTLSRFVVPIEATGPYAVAVEGAPDANLDFTGDDGQQTGAYELLLELEQASYISNLLDIIAGVSEDGTFIEDEVGYRRTGGPDVLLEGVPGDGWGLSYGARLPSGLSKVFGGSGDLLVDPGFNAPVTRSVFAIRPFGNNRVGEAEAQTLLPYIADTDQGVTLGITYQVALHQSVVNGIIDLGVHANDRLVDLLFTRLLDVDLFGVGPDTFYWQFDPNSPWQVFPVEVTDGLLDVSPPASGSGQVLGDRQVAMVVKGGTIPASSSLNPVHLRYPMAFTLVAEFGTEVEAAQAAFQNLTASNVTTWTIAVDVDPATGLYLAFGVGLGNKLP